MDTIIQKKSSPTLRDLLAPFFRQKKLLAWVFAATLLGAIGAAVLAAGTHEARMEVLVEQERLDPKVSADTNMPAPATPPAVTDESINAEVELLRSPDLLEQVVIACGLDQRERKSLVYRMLGRHEDAWYLAKATDHLSHKLKIDVVSKTNMIEVMYTASDPKLAYDVLHTLSELYLAKHLAVHRPKDSYKIFADEAAKYLKAVEDSEARLAEFGQESGAVEPDVQRTGLAQEAVTVTGALYAAKRAIATDEIRIADEQARMSSTPERSRTQETTSSAEALLQTLQGNLLTAQLKKTQLLLKYEPSYPLVQEAQQELNETQAAIAEAMKQQYVVHSTDRDPTYELIREDVAKTRADLASQQAAATALQQSLDGIERQLVDLNQKALRNADLAREVKANEDNYLLYVSKREQERTSNALDEKLIADVAIAVPPVLPILPFTSPVLVLVVGVVLALFMSVGGVFVAEHLNSSLRTPDEVFEVLRIPVLASVPKQTAL